MAGVEEAAAHLQAGEAGITIPWYRRYTRWRQTSRAEAVDAETRLLSMAGVQLEAADVPVGSKKEEFMNTIVGGPIDGPAMVMVPGYGAGIGFFFRNLASLAEQFRVHTVDLLGTGMSGRPSWTARSREDAEAFFMKSLATWREVMGIDKMVLVGHSMGGYLAARYALENPDHIQHLVLVCPAGVTRRPDDWQPPERLRNGWSVSGQIYRTATAAWEWGVTPGSIIRGIGPWGKGLINGYVNRRFREGMGLTDQESAAFGDYFYHIMSAKGSGEHALRYLLGPFAWAHDPLEDTLLQLKVPVTFIYGDNDWMDPAGAKRVVAQLRNQRPPSGPGDQEVLTISDAGHYAFLDQPEVFLKQLVNICQPYLRSQMPQAEGAGGVKTARFPGNARNIRHIMPVASHSEIQAAEAAEAEQREAVSPRRRSSSSAAQDAAMEGLSRRTDL